LAGVYQVKLQINNNIAMFKPGLNDRLSFIEGTIIVSIFFMIIATFVTPIISISAGPFALFSLLGWLMPLFCTAMIKGSPMYRIANPVSFWATTNSDFNSDRQELWDQYQSLPKDATRQIPNIKPEDVAAMTNQESRDTSIQLQNFKTAYKHQQEIISQPKKQALIRSIEDATLSLKEGTKTYQQ
jgi:hypothetical protein